MAGTLSFYDEVNRSFDKAAAERDWEQIFAMYHRQLRPYGDAPA